MEHVPELDMIPDMRFQARDAVGAKHKPDLQGTEAAAERDLPVTVVGHETGVGEIVAED